VGPRECRQSSRRRQPKLRPASRFRFLWRGSAKLMDRRKRGGRRVNRRELLWAAANVALLAGVRPLHAQQRRYDLVIKGGRVIDPSLRLDAVRDVGIAAGHIAAVEPTIDAAA